MSVKQNLLKIPLNSMRGCSSLCLVRHNTNRDTDQITEVWLSHSIICDGKYRQCSSTGRLLGIAPLFVAKHCISGENELQSSLCKPQERSTLFPILYSVFLTCFLSYSPPSPSLRFLYLIKAIILYFVLPCFSLAFLSLRLSLPQSPFMLFSMALGFLAKPNRVITLPQ